MKSRDMQIQKTSLSPITIDNTKIKMMDRMALVAKNEIHIVHFSDILYLEGDGNYTRFYVDREVILASHTLKHYTGKLPSYFQRVHRKYIINLRKIESIDKREGMTIRLNNHRIPVSRRNQPELIRYFIY